MCFISPVLLVLGAQSRHSNSTSHYLAVLSLLIESPSNLLWLMLPTCACCQHQMLASSQWLRVEPRVHPTVPQQPLLLLHVVLPSACLPRVPLPLLLLPEAQSSIGSSARLSLLCQLSLHLLRLLELGYGTGSRRLGSHHSKAQSGREKKEAAMEVMAV